MRILTYTTTSADDGRAVRSVVPRRLSLGQHSLQCIFRIVAVDVQHLLNARDQLFLRQKDMSVLERVV